MKLGENIYDRYNFQGESIETFLLQKPTTTTTTTQSESPVEEINHRFDFISF